MKSYVKKASVSAAVLALTGVNAVHINNHN